MPIVTPKGHGLGAFASKPNMNEAGFPAHLVRQSAPFPTTGCISGKLSSIRKNQLTLGCCTGEGSTNMGNRLYRRFGPQLKVVSSPDDVPDFDALFTYYLERQTEGTLAQGDCGAQVSTSLVVPDCNPGGGGFGWCPQTSPFDPNNVNVAPTATQLAAAKKWPGGAYHNIGNVISNIKACILSDYSGVIGIAVYDSFEDDSTEASGLIPFPNLEMENQLGGHEMHSLIAYDDTIQCPNSPNKGAVLTENSWGDQWGAECKLPVATGRGFAWISYDYLMSFTLASDIRMGHLGTIWP
jgi:hypothetical protein